LRPGSDPSKQLNDLYSFGRTYPREQPAEWPRRDAFNFDAAHQGKPPQRDHPSRYHRHEEIQSPQHRENQHDVHYDNDCRGWVRAAGNNQVPTGHGEDATRLGNFDRGGSWRLKDKGNDWSKR
jgi:hypothetical protein